MRSIAPIAGEIKQAALFLSAHHILVCRHDRTADHALTPSEIERYARHIILGEVGGPGQQKLKRARVLVVGAGGLGAPVLQYLAASGVGTLGIVDDDRVSLSNLQRQIIHSTELVGSPKVESAARAIAAINPHVTVEAHETRIAPDNVADLVAAMTSSSMAPTISIRAICWRILALNKSGRWFRRRSGASTAR